MFIRSNNIKAPRQDKQSRVYVTSLANITATSPTKTNWLSPRTPESAPPSPGTRTLRNILRFGLRNNKIRTTQDDDFGPIISDSISNSKHLQTSIMLMTESMAEHEVHCCKQDEARQVIRGFQKKAAQQIDEGKLHEALHNLNNSLAMQQKLYGTKHPEVATTLNMMGEVLSNMGQDYRYMAMSSFEESLAIRQELEPGSKDTAITLKNLWLLFHQSNATVNGPPSDHLHANEDQMTTPQDSDTAITPIY